MEQMYSRKCIVTCIVTTNCKKSAEAIVPRGDLRRAEQSLDLSSLQKEVSVMNAECRKEAGCPQRDSAEHEEHVSAQSVGKPGSKGTGWCRLA